MGVSIVIVDDEADVAELIRQQFHREVRQGRYVMHFAQPGDQALDMPAVDDEPDVELLLKQRVRRRIRVPLRPPR